MEIRDKKLDRIAALVVFLGVLATYASLTPGTIVGMGYTSEEMRAGNSVLAVVHGRLFGHPSPPIIHTRNGPLPLVIEIPFLVTGHHIVNEDFVLALDPVLESALLVTILFLWLRKLTSPGMAFLLTLAGAFGTMLWPYAYIGLETKQSLFLILSGYLALGCGPIRSLWKALLFGLCCAFAVCVKSTGNVLVPAVGFLFYAQFREGWRRRIPLALAAASIIGAAWMWAAIDKAAYWAPTGVTAFDQLQKLLADSPYQYLGNVIGMFGSPTKGLLLFAPPVVLAVYAIPHAWRAHRELTIFALLSVAGIVSGFAFLRFFADEVWGPRYMHTTVVPLLLLIGAGRPRFSLWRDGALIPLAAVGVVISFLGCCYYYGNMHAATMSAGENNEEEMVGDPRWNQVWFNARLLTIWFEQKPGPVMWMPGHTWMYERPPDQPPDKTIDLKAWSSPQPLLLRGWGTPRPGVVGLMWVLLLVSGICGLLLLAAAGYGLLGRGSAEDAEKHSP